MITVEVSPTIIEQINEEPKTYWRSGLVPIAHATFRSAGAVHISENAALVWQDYALRTWPNHYVGIREPSQITIDELNHCARIKGWHTVEVYDETLTVVDSWRVE